MPGVFSRKAHVTGGVARYARKDVTGLVKFLGTSQENAQLVFEEVSVIEIKLRKGNIKVVGVYRPPSQHSRTQWPY